MRTTAFCQPAIRYAEWASKQDKRDNLHLTYYLYIMYNTSIIKMEEVP